MVSEQKLDSSEPVMVLLCECCVSLKLGSRFRGVTLSHTLGVLLPSCLTHECVIDSVELLCVYVCIERRILL